MVVVVDVAAVIVAVVHRRVILERCYAGLNRGLFSPLNTGPAGRQELELAAAGGQRKAIQLIVQLAYDPHERLLIFGPQLIEAIDKAAPTSNPITGGCKYLLALLG